MIMDAVSRGNKFHTLENVIHGKYLANHNFPSISDINLL